MVFSSTNASLIGQNVSGEDFFKDGLQRNGVVTLRINKPSEKLLQYLSGPIIVEGKTVAVAVIVDRADDIISLVSDYVGGGKTGETLLTRKDARGNAVFITPARFDPHAAFTRVVPKDKVNVPAVHAVQGEETTFANAVDYRGVPVFAATRYVKEADWGIVVKMDKAEAMEQMNKLQGLFWLIVLIVILLIIVIGAIISRSITTPIWQLAALAKKIASGDLSQSILVTSRDEVGELGGAFNDMTKKLQEYQYGLEEKIKARTAELSEKTDYILQEKVKDEAILSSIGEGVIATDEGGRVLFMNTFALAVFGLKERNVKGRFPTELFEISDEGGNIILKDSCPVANAIKKREKISTSDYYYSRPDRSRFPVTITVAPVILNGALVGTIEVFRDITKEKDIDKAKTEFVSLASHQLRSPLSIIKWYSEMLLSGSAMKLRKREREYMKEIYRSNQNAIDLVDTLLDVSRLELGTYIGEPSMVNVAKVVRGVIAEKKLTIKEKKLKCIFSTREGKPIIQTDPKLLRMVFQNLLSNAIKYTPSKGKIVMSLSAPEKTTILFKISDTGHGIPRDQYGKLFTKFFRASNVRQRTEGTGLGLYIVKSITEKLGGTIRFESEENKGTTFFVSIPIA